MNQIDRIKYYENIEEEKLLRENIRQIIRFVKEKRATESKKTNDELMQLRGLIHDIVTTERANIYEVATPDNDPAPNKTTGINVLEDLLKKIIPILEDDYKLLTTSTEQRSSFRSHIINGVVSSLAPAKANDSAELTADVREALEVDIDGDQDPPEFIDINKDEVPAEEQASPEEEFGSGLEDQDETGRNMAFQSFKKIEKGVLDSYELLQDPDDKKLFYDYLLANLKLYFDRFESELSTDVTEPESAEYEQAKEPEPTASNDLNLEI
jgi:hypothetical protein|tara:strand:+ start:12616 stop:13419 length:804 start_codon:yes stop_codon:yes gene_type:complete